EHLLVAADALEGTDADAAEVRVHDVGAMVRAVDERVPGLVRIGREGDVLPGRHEVKACIPKPVVGRLLVRRLVREVVTRVHVAAVLPGGILEDRIHPQGGYTDVCSSAVDALQ